MATADQLRSMDLQIRGENDEYLSYNLWDRKLANHRLVKLTYQSDQPKDDGAWWRYEQGPTADQLAPRCNLPIVAVRLKAFVPQAGRENADLDMTEEGFLAKKKMTEWSKKQKNPTES